MTSLDPFSCRLHFAATYGRNTREARRLSEEARAGRLVRVHRGVYVSADDWSRCDARARHVLRTRAVMSGLRSCVVSHESAAAVHDLPRVHDRFDRVAVIDTRRTTTKTSRDLRRRLGDVPSSDVVRYGDLDVTNLDRTAADVATTASFADAVLCVDAVLRRVALPHGHRSGVAIDAAIDRHRAALLAAVGDGSAPGQRAARRAIGFASAFAENGGESLGRVVLFELGIVAPILQRDFWLGSEFLGRGDFFLAEYGALLEFDGFAKYDDEALRGGRSLAQVIRDEKQREARLLRHPEVRLIVRFEYRDLVEPGRLAVRLRSVGIPVDPRRVDAAARAALKRFAATS